MQRTLGWAKNKTKFEKREAVMTFLNQNGPTVRCGSAVKNVIF